MYFYDCHNLLTCNHTRELNITWTNDIFLLSKPQPFISTVIPYWKNIKTLDRQLSDRIYICKNTSIIRNVCTPKIFKNMGL